MALRVAVLIKQVPLFEAMQLGSNGRLQREGLPLEMNPYCRRAVSKGVDVARATGGRCTVFTLGPPVAEDALREAVAWGADDAVLITDPAFAGSDTLATARAIAAALQHTGPFDLVLAGRNSVDADTGQVGPEVAELLGLPFLAGVKVLDIDADTGRVRARCEYDDGFVEAETSLPVVLSCAERLCEPAKVDAEGRAAVADDRIRRLSAPDLGDGPWGQAGSPTWVGEVRVLESERHRVVLDGPVSEQVRRAVELLRDAGALNLRSDAAERADDVVGRVATAGGNGPVTAAVLEHDRPRMARELLGAAARIASQMRGSVVALSSLTTIDAATASAWGADQLVRLDGSAIEDDVARAVASWCAAEMPWAVLAPGTMWGRDVASRVAARLGAGLTGDAVDLDVRDGRLVGWKPAFGGRLVAAITATSPIQMATVRPGMLPVFEPRAATDIAVREIAVEAAGRVRHRNAGRDDDLDTLVLADIVVGVGTGIMPEEYPELDPLLSVLGAVLGATRKVTDKGWLPRSRQVGITGRSISPRLYIALGLSGKFNHVVGIRGAGQVLAVNTDPAALVFQSADVGIVGDWHEVVPLLVAELLAERVEAL